jgi:tail assembly chaperone
MEDSKDVEVKGVKYQVGRLKARHGSWILAQVLTKMLPGVLERAFAKQGAKLAAGRSDMSEEEFTSIQGHALAVCRRYDKAGLPMPVFVQPDRWAVKDLEFDLTTVMALTVHALTFNLGSFFAEGGLALIMDCIPGLNAPVADPDQAASLPDTQL